MLHAGTLPSRLPGAGGWFALLLLLATLPLAGCHDGEPAKENLFDLQPAPPSSRSSRIPVPATLAGVPEPLPPPRTVAEAAATPIQLTLNPPSVIVQPAGSFDLRANVQALADFSDQTTRDVSRDVLYGNPSGGTLAGNDFKPSAGAAAGSVTVSFIRGNRTVSSVLAIGVAPGKPRTTALILSPAGATLTPGAVYVLAANVQALARLATGTTSDVSSLVTFGSPTGGKLKGGSFVAGPPGAGSVIATLRLDSQTVTATFGFTISLNEPRPVALAARPPSLAPATRAPVDLSGALRFDATFEDGSSQDVTGATSLVDATGGSLTGTFFTFAAGVGAGSVTASFATTRGAVAVTVPLRLTATALPFPASLAARALTTSIAAGSTLDLMASVVASVRLSDGTTRDVSHEVGYTAASGGTLTGSLLSASPGAAAVALRVGFPAAAPTLVATFALAVTGPPPVPTALTATSAVATVAAGSLFGLRENLAVTATFTAGPPRSVSAVVAFSRPTGGMLVGDSFLAGNGAGPASVLLTFVSNGAGVTATFSFDVTSTASPAVSLAVSPAAVTVAAGSRFSLAAAIRATSRRADGTTTDVTRELRFDTPVGGTLSGTEFVSATDRSAGSVRVTLPGCGSCTATVSFVIQAVGAAVPVSLALRPERVAVESGGALDLREVVGALATLSNGDVEDVSGRLAFSDPSGGTLSGTVFQVAFGVSAGSVLATYTRNGSSARAPFAFSVASGERVPVALTLSPAVLGVVEGAPCDLRQQVSARVRFHDGTVDDVSASAVLSSPTGGSLSGSVFTAASGFAAGSVQLAFTVRGHTVSGTVRFSIQPARSGVTGLALSPSAVTIAAGSRYGLRANVEVTASFDDGTTRAVSNGVEWVEPVGGRVLSTAEGAVFAPLAGSGTAFVKARYSSGGFTRSATLALDIVQPLPAKAQLVLRPALVALAPGVSLDLPANVQAVLRAEDGSEQQVTREVHWLYPVGGELRRTPSGIAFEAAGDGSDGSVLAVYAAPSQALSARLPIAISEVSRTSRSLGEATVGQPLVLSLTERSPRLASGPLRASTAALETAGLQLDARGVLRGTPIAASSLAFVTAAGTTPTISYDTWFLDVVPAVRLAPPVAGPESAVELGNCAGVPAAVAVRALSDKGIACGDLDGDGRPDWVVLEGQDGRERLTGFLALPGGRCGAGRELADVPGAIAVQAGDFDADGLSDVLVIRPASVELLRNVSR